LRFGAIHTHIHISSVLADVQKRQSDAFSVLLRSVNMIYHTDVKQTQLWNESRTQWDLSMIMEIMLKSANYMKLDIKQC